MISIRGNNGAHFFARRLEIQDLPPHVEKCIAHRGETLHIDRIRTKKHPERPPAFTEM